MMSCLILLSSLALFGFSDPAIATVVGTNEGARSPIAPNRKSTRDFEGAPFSSTSTDRDGILGTVKAGLFPVGSNATVKTIFLIDGESSSSSAYVLNLRPNEKILSVLHVVNDSKIITSQSKHVREIGDIPFPRYNISIAHEFEGQVGVASYDLHVTTSFARYTSSCIFHVSGIVAFVNGRTSSVALVSGMGSPGLSFPNPDSVAIQNSSVGQIPLSISYQAPGPDVISNAPSFLIALKSAEIDIRDTRPESQLPLLNFNQSICGNMPTLTMDSNGKFLFPDANCGVGFHEASKKLVFNLNRQQSGNIVITISIPALFMGDEMFETSINIFVGSPVFRKPVLLLNKNLDIALDYFGSEEFSVQMYNTIQPALKHNATGLYISLPGMRYGEIDFEKSILTNPIQTIVFRTVPPSDEDEKIVSLLKNALAATNQSTTSRAEFVKLTSRSIITREEVLSKDGAVGSLEDAQKQIRDHDSTVHHGKPAERRLSSDLLEDTVLEESDAFAGFTYSRKLSPTSNQPLMRMDTHSYEESAVFVVIPPREVPVRAVSSGEGTIRTEIAAPELAMVNPEESRFPEKIRVTMRLEDYSISGFSEHKSRQIREALLKEALQVQNGTEGETRLVKLRKDGSGLIVEYDVYVSGHSEEIANALMKKGVSAEIARQAYLEEHRIEIISAMAMTFKETTGNLLGSSGETAASGGSIGVLVAAIAVLSLIVAIPLFVLCFGVIVTRRHEQRENQSDRNSSEPASPTRSPENTEQASVTGSPLARDTFGRGDVTTSESFQMQKEYFQEGYYGDNTTSGENAKQVQ